MTMQCYSFQRMMCILTSLFFLYSQQTHAQQVFAGSQANGVTGFCLLCGVTNAGNAVNADLTDYSQLNITAGLGTVSVYQTLIFPAGSSGCDSLRIVIGSSGTPGASAYESIIVQTYNGNTANNDAQSVSSSILRPLQGYAKAEVLLKPLQIFDRVRITLTRQRFGGLANLRIYYAYRQPALQPPVAADSISICKGAGALLTATPAPGGTVKWYDAPSGGQPLATGNSFSVTPPATTTYYAASSSGDCASARRPITVIVNKLPAPAVNIPVPASCGSQVLTVDNYHPGLRYRVRITYTTADAQPVLDTSFVITNGHTITAPASHSPSNLQAMLYVQAVDTLAGCSSDTLQAAFTAGGTGMLPTTDAAVISTCQGSTVTLHAFTADPHIPNINWYDAPAGGHLLYTGDYYTVRADSNATYYATSQAQCEFPQRVAIQVVTTPRPPAPVLGTADTVHAYRFDAVTLSAAAADSSVVHWYRSDTGATIVHTGNNYRFNVLTPGTLYFYAGTNKYGCGSIRKKVVVMVSSSTAPAARSAAMDTAAAPAVKQRAAVTAQQPPVALQLYPNPTGGEIRFTTGKDLSGALLIIRDMNGREVRREVLQRNGANISQLGTAGIYFIQVITRQQEVYNGKVMLQR